MASACEERLPIQAVAEDRRGSVPTRPLEGLSLVYEHDAVSLRCSSSDAFTLIMANERRATMQRSDAQFHPTRTI
jgi:hypothetical protein